MAGTDPTAELDVRYGDPEATATPWATAERTIADAEVFWVGTVRPDGRPHVTPLLAVLVDGRLHFCTGPGERKARNLVENARCFLLTGTNTQAEGLDVVVEGEAVRVTDDARLAVLADAWVAKYGEDWRFVARDGAFVHGRELDQETPAAAHVFELVPDQGFGFGKGEVFSQTRWRW